MDIATKDSARRRGGPSGGRCAGARSAEGDAVPVHENEPQPRLGEEFLNSRSVLADEGEGFDAVLGLIVAVTGLRCPQAVVAVAVRFPHEAPPGRQTLKTLSFFVAFAQTLTDLLPVLMGEVPVAAHVPNFTDFDGDDHFGLHCWPPALRLRTQNLLQLT